MYVRHNYYYYVTTGESRDAKTRACVCVDFVKAVFEHRNFDSGRSSNPNSRIRCELQFNQLLSIVLVCRLVFVRSIVPIVENTITRKPRSTFRLNVLILSLKYSKHSVILKIPYQESQRGFKQLKMTKM